MDNARHNSGFLLGSLVRFANKKRLKMTLIALEAVGAFGTSIQLITTPSLRKKFDQNYN